MFILLCVEIVIPGENRICPCAGANVRYVKATTNQQ
jgi:hypothetical protein